MTTSNTTANLFVKLYRYKVIFFSKIYSSRDRNYGTTNILKHYKIYDQKHLWKILIRMSSICKMVFAFPLTKNRFVSTIGKNDSKICF